MASVEEHAASLISRLGGPRFDGYLYRPIPSEADGDVRAVVDAYRAAERPDRAALAGRLSTEAVDILESYSERQAVAAVRIGSVEPISLGLVALGMCVPRGDRAQALMALAKLDHSARLLGSDLADVAAEVADVLSDEARYSLARFLARDDRDETLLGRMGFAGYGSGDGFVYDNLSPGATPPEPAAGAPRAPAPGTGGFLFRGRYTSVHPAVPTAIGVKDGAVVAIDRLGERRTFPLHGPDAPRSVVRYFDSGGRSGRTAAGWSVTDGHSQALLSGSEDDWNPDDFVRLAEVAGLHFDAEALAPSYRKPPPRHDYVDLSAKNGSGWALLWVLLVPVFGLYSIIGLFDGYPWLWPAFWGVACGLHVSGEVRLGRTISRNCAALPPDEMPAAPWRKYKNPGRTAVGFLAFVLGPPLLVYLIRNAPPLP